MSVPHFLTLGIKEFPAVLLVVPFLAVTRCLQLKKLGKIKADGQISLVLQFRICHAQNAHYYLPLVPMQRSTGYQVRCRRRCPKVWVWGIFHGVQFTRCLLSLTYSVSLDSRLSLIMANTMPRKRGYASSRFVICKKSCMSRRRSCWRRSWGTASSPASATSVNR